MHFRVALLGVALAATPAWGQIEYRNLDAGRPFRVEDAYPLERYGFEFTGGYHRVHPAGGRAAHLMAPQLAYGAARGIAVALGAPVLLSAAAPGGPIGLAGIGVSMLANATTERRGVPGLGVRLDVTLPAGRAGPSSPTATVTLLATRNFGRSRLHLNAGAGLGRPDRPAAAEPSPLGLVGVLADRTLLRSSTLVAVEMTVARERAGMPILVAPGVGLRRQITPTMVLDLGVSVGLSAGSRAESSFRAGFSHLFGLASLLPASRR